MCFALSMSMFKCDRCRITRRDSTPSAYLEENERSSRSNSRSRSADANPNVEDGISSSNYGDNDHYTSMEDVAADSLS